MVLDSQDLELGDAHEEIKVDYQGEAINLGLNVSYLLEALSVIEEKIVEVKMKDIESPCFIKPADNPDYFCLIMPMRIDD
jgi:DNA polymerase-3 subunit beta